MPRGKHTNHVRGESHPRFNPDQLLSSHGYVKIRVGAGHELADRNGYAYEHLLVWVNSGRQKPADGCTIHHINENKQDNRIENLQLVSRHEHATLYYKMVSDLDVRDIRVAYAEGKADMPTLANRYGIPIARVHKFITGLARLKAGGPISTNNRKKKAGRILDGREWSEFPR